MDYFKNGTTPLDDLEQMDFTSEVEDSFVTRVLAKIEVSSDPQIRDLYVLPLYHYANRKDRDELAKKMRSLLSKEILRQLNEKA